jgi:large conductance mechanosensitive channel
MKLIVNSAGHARAVVEDFKAFLLKHNFVSMAVGVVLGVAVNDVVSSLVKTLIEPLIGVLAGGKTEFGWTFALRNQQFLIGKFTGSIVNFLIIAAIVFLIMKTFIKAPPPGPPTRDCPECLEKVPVAAKRCKFCTSALPAGAGA